LRGVVRRSGWNGEDRGRGTRMGHVSPALSCGSRGSSRRQRRTRRRSSNVGFERGRRSRRSVERAQRWGRRGRRRVDQEPGAATWHGLAFACGVRYQSSGEWSGEKKRRRRCCCWERGDARPRQSRQATAESRARGDSGGGDAAWPRRRCGGGARAGAARGEALAPGRVRNRTGWS